MYPRLDIPASILTRTSCSILAWSFVAKTASVQNPGRERALTLIKLDVPQSYAKRVGGLPTPVRATSGKNVLTTLVKDGLTLPLLHLQPFGQGRIAYLASSQDVDLTRSAINALIGGMPITVNPGNKQAILNWQKQGAGKGRWILHFIQDGDYVVTLRSDYASPQKIIGQYPDTAWPASLESRGDSIEIKAGGSDKDRLLVLQ